MVNNKNEKFSQRLRELRREKNVSQNVLSKSIGVSSGLISLYESGKRIPTINIASKIASFFDVSVDYLLGNTDEPLPNPESDEKQKMQTIEEIISNISEEDKSKIDIEALKRALNKALVVARRIPYLISISKGKSLDEQIKNAENTFLIPKKMKADFALKMQDDSMRPYIKMGDTILCLKTNKLEKDDIGVFTNKKLGVLVRKYTEYENAVILRTVNVNWENGEIVIPKKEFRREWKIAAKVVGIFQTFEKETSNKE
jgi:transcriptional regulator with XRE-family HTH domain